MRRRFERRRPPLLEVITGWTEGPPPVLPDEEPGDGRTIRWSAGALDGVLARDLDAAREPARGAELAALIEQAATGDEQARAMLYDAARADGIVFALDEALAALADVPPTPVAELGRELMRSAEHREPLKLGVALVGRTGDERDVPVLETLARHDEFSRVAGVALASLLEDPVAAWWTVGRLARGWGKVEAVGRLAEIPSLPPEVRAWLLRHGCDNAVTPEYLAYACATAGGLEDALGGLVDDELLDGACTIVRALVHGGPAEDIDDYEPGPRVVAIVVALVAERPTSLQRLRTVVDLRRWAEDFEQHVAIAERCGRMLARADVRAYVTERLERRDDVIEVWEIAAAVGVDPWEPGWRHAQAGPVEAALYQRLARTASDARWNRLARLAEERLPLDVLGSGPRDQLFPAPQLRDSAHALLFLLQEMRGGRWSAPLVVAGLLNPVIPTRNAALHAVGRMPPHTWGDPVARALQRLGREEPLEDVRERALEQLGRAR